MSNDILLIIFKFNVDSIEFLLVTCLNKTFLLRSIKCLFNRFDLLIKYHVAGNHIVCTFKIIHDRNIFL